MWTRKNKSFFHNTYIILSIKWSTTQNFKLSFWLILCLKVYIRLQKLHKVWFSFERTTKKVRTKNICRVLSTYLCFLRLMQWHLTIFVTEKFASAQRMNFRNDSTHTAWTVLLRIWFFATSAFWSLLVCFGHFIRLFLSSLFH